MGGFASFEKKKKLIYSMLTLAGILGVSVALTTAATSYFRGQDPVNRCITDPLQQPYQISVPIEVFEDGISSTVRDVGVSENCIRPVHTLMDNVIHVAYEKPHDFTLGHFFYYWLGNDILRYDTEVYVNNQLRTNGDFRDIVLRQGDVIRINLTTRN